MTARLQEVPFSVALIHDLQPIYVNALVQADALCIVIQMYTDAQTYTDVYYMQM